jgi:alanine-synthesizing transaminase
MQQQNRGIHGVTAEDVFIGNGVSELIDLSLRALLNPGDEVLLPSPDYPLWTAATVLNDGVPLHYACRPEAGWVPDPDEIESLVTANTRAIVIINPNNPTGAVYPRDVLKRVVEIARRHHLVVFSDEIYDQMTYDGVQHVPLATLADDVLCATFSGLSKVYRACGYRVGWVVFSGDREHAQGYLDAMELLAALRLCSNVPGQWAVQTALGGFQSIGELVTPGGKLYESRRAVIDACAGSDFLELTPPAGAMYAFPRVRKDDLPSFDDYQFAMDLLEHKHVLIAPGISFNVPYRDHFRITTLPEPAIVEDALGRMDELLHSYRVSEI